MKKILSTPHYIALFIFLISALALSGAFIAQYAFDLHPCKLCIYQRWPFVITGVIGFLIAAFSKNLRVTAYLTFLTGLVFLANAGIALFHSGVERKYWEGLEGCSAPDLTGSMAEILEKIKNAPVARCDEIPWADPILHLSMANYNVIYCLIAFALCFLAGVMTLRRSNGYI